MKGASIVIKISTCTTETASVGQTGFARRNACSAAVVGRIGEEARRTGRAAAPIVEVKVSHA